VVVNSLFSRSKFHMLQRKYFRKNRHRLTSNFDVHQLIKSIIDEKFYPEDNATKYEKGINLLHPISANRTCLEASVPENHCLCMEPLKLSTIQHKNLTAKILQFLKTQFSTNIPEKYAGKCQPIIDKLLEIQNVTTLVPNQLVQFGVKDPTELEMEKVEGVKQAQIRFHDVSYSMGPEVKGQLRLRHYWKSKGDIMKMASKPLVFQLEHYCGNLTRSLGDNPEILCPCLANLLAEI